MSSSEKTAGCEMVLTAAPGEPASLDEERDTAQACCTFPTFDDMRAV